VFFGRFLPNYLVRLGIELRFECVGKLVGRASAKILLLGKRNFFTFVTVMMAIF
jgi:hypothetical protein